jgi:hypothetical protein
MAGTNKPNMKTSLSFLLGKIEVTRGVDPLPDATNDAYLVGDLDLQLEPTAIERNIFQRSFSPTPEGVGRKVVNVNFNAEIKSSGDVGTTRPKLGTLLRACGMRELLVTAGAATQIEAPVAFGAITGPAVTWAKTTVPSSIYGSYKVRCVVGGASATAELQVFRWAEGEPDTTVLPNSRHEARTNDSATTTLTLNDTNLTSLDFTVAGAFQAGDDLYATVGGCTFQITVTSGMTDVSGVATALAALIDAESTLTASAVAGVITVTFAAGAVATVTTSGTTAIPLGASGAEITPTWAGDLVVGQEWIVSLYELGYMYRPESDQTNVESITLYVYKDGVLHKVTSCSGTFTLTGESGSIGQAQFEFQGNYLPPVEEPTPLDAVFEQTIPVQVELAQMSINGDADFCAQSFTYALANTLNAKECMNALDGFDGYSITDREPTAALNPEATYEAFHGWWEIFSDAVQIPLHTRVGTTAGNIVRIYAERANFTGLTYGDRNNSVTLEAAFQLNGLSAAGDDELRVAFT